MSGATWLVANNRTDDATLARMSAACTVSNGYVGLRGHIAEDDSGAERGTFIRGIYDTLDLFGQLRPSSEPRPWLDPAHFDQAGRSPAIANLPDPLLVRAFVAERELSLNRATVVSFDQRLNLACGLYQYTIDLRDARGRTTRLSMQRFASLMRPHCVFMRYAATPLDHDAPLVLQAGIDGRTRSLTTGEQTYQIERTDAEGARCAVDVITPARAHRVQIRSATSARAGAPVTSLRPRVMRDQAYCELAFARGTGAPAAIEHVAVLASSEDEQRGVAVDVNDELQAAAEQGFSPALREHVAAWRALWAVSDVEIDGDEQAQRAMRFCVFHLLAAAPRCGASAGVPVKLLSGEGYQGNTFYDTDLYIVPFYAFTQPEYAVAHFHWRRAGLVAGREIARGQGFQGAKFAWQAGPHGEECLGPWYRFVRTNIHINGDVCASLMQTVDVTGDRSLLNEQGRAILVESARFYASRAVYDASHDAYDFHDVAGPDESHCDSRSNFYTNLVAQKTLRWTAELLDDNVAANPGLPAETPARLPVSAEEQATWRRIADRLVIPFDPATGVFEQCAGFFRLPDPPADLLADRREWFVPLWRYQAMNQPDVLMALALFCEDLPPEVLRVNWNVYRSRSLDFSSMSHAVHAIVAARLNQRDEAYREFLTSAVMDLEPERTGRGDTASGLHGTAMGGAWLALMVGLAGLRVRDGVLHLHPRLPAHWTGLRFRVGVRGVQVRVSANHRTVEIAADSAAARPLTVGVCEKTRRLRPGQRLVFDYGAD